MKQGKQKTAFILITNLKRKITHFLNNSHTFSWKSILIFTLDILAYNFFEFRILKSILHCSVFFHNKVDVNFATELNVGSL